MKEEYHELQVGDFLFLKFAATTWHCDTCLATRLILGKTCEGHFRFLWESGIITTNADCGFRKMTWELIR